MGQLVQNRGYPAFSQGLGHCTSKHVSLSDGYGTSVFHGARVEVGHKKLVVLLERIRKIKGRLKKLETLASLGEHVVGLKILL